MPSPLRHALTTLALLATPLASADSACAPARAAGSCSAGSAALFQRTRVAQADAEGEAVEAEPYTKSTVERLTLQAGQSLLHLSNGETALAMLVASVE